MAEKAGPARAAGKLASGTARIVLGPRKVRMETRSGTVRTKRGADTPPVELELGAEERLLDFVIVQDSGPHILVAPRERLDWEKRKTVDWRWEAVVEVPVPTPPQRANRKPRSGKRSTSNGRRRGAK